MLTLKNLVVVLEWGRDSQPAWEAARTWAALSGAHLHVFLPVSGESPKGLELASGLRQVAAHTAELEGERWLESWLREAPPGTTQTVVASPKWCEAVIHETRRQEADLLLVGAEAAPTAKDLQHLLRQLPCPLYLVRKGGSIKRLAGAIGAAAEDAPHRLLNAVVLEHLSGLTKLWGAESRLLSALPNPAELVPLMGDAYAISYVGDEVGEAYQRGLVEQARPFGLSESRILTRIGRPDVVIPQLVDEEGIDCLLLGTVSRNALAAFWLGNTAEDVLPRVSCNVLVLRPQDYFEPDQ